MKFTALKFSRALRTSDLEAQKAVDELARLFEKQDIINGVKRKGFAPAIVAEWKGRAIEIIKGPHETPGVYDRLKETTDLASCRTQLNKEWQAIEALPEDKRVKDLLYSYINSFGSALANQHTKGARHL